MEWSERVMAVGRDEEEKQINQGVGSEEDGVFSLMFQHRVIHLILSFSLQSVRSSPPRSVFELCLFQKYNICARPIHLQERILIWTFLITFQLQPSIIGRLLRSVNIIQLESPFSSPEVAKFCTTTISVNLWCPPPRTETPISLRAEKRIHTSGNPPSSSKNNSIFAAFQLSALLW